MDARGCRQCKVYNILKNSIKQPLNVKCHRSNLVSKSSFIFMVLLSLWLSSLNLTEKNNKKLNEDKDISNLEVVEILRCK